MLIVNEALIQVYDINDHCHKTFFRPTILTIHVSRILSQKMQFIEKQKNNQRRVSRDCSNFYWQKGLKSTVILQNQVGKPGLDLSESNKRKVLLSDLGFRYQGESFFDIYSCFEKR